MCPEGRVWRLGDLLRLVFISVKGGSPCDEGDFILKKRASSALSVLFGQSLILNLLWWLLIAVFKPAPWQSFFYHFTSICGLKLPFIFTILVKPHKQSSLFFSLRFRTWQSTNAMRRITKFLNRTQARRRPLLKYVTERFRKVEERAFRRSLMLTEISLNNWN